MRELLRAEVEADEQSADEALLAHVLRAVRETLAGHPGASAVVRVDGRAYRLHEE